jgi:hypothetical protein
MSSCSPSTQEPLFNFEGASSNHDIDINPESPPKKQKKSMAAKPAQSKEEKNTKAPQKKLPSHQSTSEKPRKHCRRNHFLYRWWFFVIVGGFFSFGGCAPTVFLVVISWLGGFFCGGFFRFEKIKILSHLHFITFSPIHFSG